MKYNGSNLKKVLEAHERWFNKSAGWTDDDRANLYGANLYGANLHGADLRGANLRCADLRGADLYGANLHGADLRGANLHGADLYGANLYGADLRGAKNIPFIPLKCPEVGAFIGWKKASGNSIVKLQITEDAKRSSATTDKCRCSKAIVLAIENIDGTPYASDEVRSTFNGDFIYKVGETVSVDDFDDDRWKECSTGIHFFINRQIAVEY